MRSRRALKTQFRNAGQVKHLEFPFQNAHFMKKIPKGAEASNILVGELNILDKPLSAFIRLSEATILGDLTEVPVPTRFIFILLGPAVIQVESLLFYYVSYLSLRY